MEAKQSISNCPYCQQNDLLISLDFASALAENADLAPFRPSHSAPANNMKATDSLDREGKAQMRAATFWELIQDPQSREEGLFEMADYLNIVEEPNPYEIISSGVIISLLALLAMFIILVAWVNQGSQFYLPWWQLGAALILLILGFVKMFMDTNKDESNFDKPAFLEDMEEYQQGMEVIKRSYYCFRDDICFDPIESAAWKPNATPTIFDSIRN